MKKTFLFLCLAGALTGCGQQQSQCVTGPNQAEAWTDSCKGQRMDPDHTMFYYWMMSSVLRQSNQPTYHVYTPPPRIYVTSPSRSTTSPSQSSPSRSWFSSSPSRSTGYTSSPKPSSGGSFRSGGYTSSRPSSSPRSSGYSSSRSSSRSSGFHR